MPKNVYPKSRKEDIDDAVMNSEYDEKLRKAKEKEKLGEMLTEIRDFILERDPKLECYLDVFRGCQDLLKKIEVIA